MQVWKGMDAFVLVIISVSHDLRVEDNDLHYYVITDSKQSIEE